MALSSYTYTWAVGVGESRPATPMTALDLIDRAAALDVPAVQIADNLALHLLSAHELDELAERASRAGVAIEVGTRGIEPDHLRRYVELAQRLGSPIVRVVVDNHERHPTPAEALAVLAPQRPTFEDAGVVLAIENHDRYPAATVADLVRGLGSWAGVCLDTVNSFAALEGPRAVLAELAPLTVNVHMKDFCVVRAWHGMGFLVEGRPVGQGQLDVPWLLEAIGPRAAGLTAVIELWTPPEEHVEATIVKETRWAEESVAYLRELMSVS